MQALTRPQSLADQLAAVIAVLVPVQAQRRGRAGAPPRAP